MNRLKILRRLIKEFKMMVSIFWYDFWGILFITIKCYRLAEKVFKRGLDFSRRRYPEFAASFTTWIIWTYDYRGEKDTALRMFKERIENNPKKTECYLDLADFYLLNNKKELAIQNYKKALELETDKQSRSLIQAELNKLSDRKD